MKYSGIMGQLQGKDQLPVTIGDRHTCITNNSIWAVHEGYTKSGKEPVTVFVFNFANKSEDEIKLARSAHLRLKTLRHPNILQYIDGVELPDCIYMMTEAATPLQTHLQSQEGQSQHLISWGLHQITKSIIFLSKDCGLVHNNISMAAVFVNVAGEYKLGGVEYLHPYNDTSPPPAKPVDLSHKYSPPEASKPTARRAEKWSTDMWGLGCLVWEVFNGPLPQSAALKNTNKIPKSLVPHYCQLVSGNPRSRPSPSSFLLSLQEEGGYFDNQFISLTLKLEELQIMESGQRNQFFTRLNKSLDIFTDNFARYKILPHLLNAFEYGGAGSAVLAPLFKIGALLDNVEYQNKIVPCVVKLFNSNDRATRVNLLQQLEHFIDHLQPSTVNDQIFPKISTGFTDTEPVLREQTIKSMLLITPKLSDATINNQLLKCLAKCQMDEQPGIRTNTTVCLGKIAQHLSSKTRGKVLISAFTRALKDPFPPARVASINGLSSTVEYYDINDCATRILPVLSTMTVDRDITVRQLAFKVIKIYLNKLEENSEKISTTASESDKANEGTVGWTGWAVSSISKLYTTTDQRSTGSTDVKSSAKSSADINQHKPHQHKQQDDQNQVQDQRHDQCHDDIEDEGWDDFDIKESESRNPKHDNWKSQTKKPADDDGGWGDGWGDDSWEDFDTSPRDPPSQTAAPSKSGMKLAKKDVLTDDNFWNKMSPVQSKPVKEKTPPPMVPASVFGDSGDGWGQWDNMESPDTQDTKHASDGDGWEGDSWEPLTPPGSNMGGTTAHHGNASSKQELMKKREERRLKQQALRDKRSGGMALKPSGLGAVKKD